MCNCPWRQWGASQGREGETWREGAVQLSGCSSWRGPVSSKVSAVPFGSLVELGKTRSAPLPCMEDGDRETGEHRRDCKLKLLLFDQDPEDSAKLQPLVRTRTISAVSTASRIDFNVVSVDGAVTLTRFRCVFVVRNSWVYYIQSSQAKDSCVSATWTRIAKDCVLWALQDVCAACCLRCRCRGLQVVHFASVNECRQI